MKAARLFQRRRPIPWDRALGIVFLCLFATLCILPIWAVVSISLSSERLISLNGYSLIPQGLCLDAYRFTLRASGWQLSRAYGITITTTLTGTALSLLSMSMMAYALSRPDFTWSRPLSFVVYFTLLFNGGMVPSYMVVTRVLQIKDTILALILPYTVGAWNLLLMRTFFKGIPFELIEAAKIDGAGNFAIYVRVVAPLGKTAFATIGVLVALHYWNDWWLPLLYVDSNRLTNLQYLLYRIMANIQSIQELAALGAVDVDYANIPSETVRMAMCILVAGPMLVLFPFFQRFFARGLVAGSVKG